MEFKSFDSKTREKIYNSLKNRTIEELKIDEKRYQDDVIYYKNLLNEIFNELQITQKILCDKLNKEQGSL